MKGIKFILALLLLPLVVAQMWTLVDLLAAWFPAGHWRATPSICVGLGFSAWLVVFFALPHPLWVYVLSHELTHALAVYLSGGKVYAIQVASTGGHVASDRVNWWISLSPYFIPLYTLIVMGLWYSINFYYSLHPYLPLLCLAFGFTFSFHVTYTISMLHKDQKDLISQGFFFSAVVIVAMNLLLVTLFFIPVAQNVNWMFAARQLATRATQCYSAPAVALIKSQQRTLNVPTPEPWTPPQVAVGSTYPSGYQSSAGMLRLSREEETTEGAVRKEITRANRGVTSATANVRDRSKTKLAQPAQPLQTEVAKAPMARPAEDKKEPVEYDVSNAPRAIAIDDSVPAPKRSGRATSVIRGDTDPAVRVRPVASPAPVRKSSLIPNVIPTIGVITNPQGI